MEDEKCVDCNQEKSKHVLDFDGKLYCSDDCRDFRIFTPPAPQGDLFDASAERTGYER